MTEENTTQTTDNTVSPKQAATRKEILAPLATYGVIAIGIVAVIITTAIMLNKELNTIEQDVAQLERDLAAQNTATEEVEPLAAVQTTDGSAGKADDTMSTGSTATEAPAGPAEAAIAAETAAEAAAIPTDHVAIADHDDNSADPVTNNRSAVTAIVTAANEAPQPAPEASTDTADASTTATRHHAGTAEADPSRQVFLQEIRNMMKQRMTEQQAMMQQRDQQQLESYKAAMNKQIEMLHRQIERTQKMIADIEKRNQQNYRLRAADMEQRQARRKATMEAMLERI